MIDEQGYLKASGIVNRTGIKGGQELILYEIIGALWEYKIIWVPFRSSGTLIDKLVNLGRFQITIGFPLFREDYSYPIDAVYFGTPTIVNDKLLFACPESWWAPEFPWTKNNERQFVKDLCDNMELIGCRRIVSGLGSGDISVEERLEDMGGGRVVCFKDFGEFQDWVLVRDL